MKSLFFKRVIAQGSSQLLTDDAYNVVRIVVAVWKGNTGQTPMTSAGAAMNTPLIQVALNGMDLERVLMDKYIPLTVTGNEKGSGDGYTPMLKNVQFYHKWTKAQNIYFGDNGNLLPDRRVVVSMLSDSAGSPNPGFLCGYLLARWEDA